MRELDVMREKRDLEPLPTAADPADAGAAERPLQLPAP